MKKTLFLTLAFAVLFGLSSARTHAQTAATPDQLFKTIQSLDTQLFDAYNHSDLTTLGSLVSEDLEFYHDKTGLAVGRQVFLDAIKNNICGKVTRELVPGTLKFIPSPITEPSKSVCTPSTTPISRQYRRSQVHHPLASERRQMAGHSRHQLRPSSAGEGIETTHRNDRQSLVLSVSFKSCLCAQASSGYIQSKESNESDGLSSGRCER